MTMETSLPPGHEQSALEVWTAWVEQWCAVICDFVYQCIYTEPNSLEVVESIVVKTFTAAFQQYQPVDTDYNPAISLFSLTERNVADFWRTPRDDFEIASQMTAPSTDWPTEPWRHLPEFLYQMLLLRYRVGLKLSEIAVIRNYSRKLADSQLSRALQHADLSEQEMATLAQKQSPDMALPIGFEAKVRQRLLAQLNAAPKLKGENRY